LSSLLRFFLFPRFRTRVDPGAGSGIAGLERLHLATDEGDVEAWFLRGDGVSTERPGPAVLYAHGNADLIEDHAGWLEPYRRLGVSLLLPEFRGYGRSAGSPSERAITEDFVAFYDLLASRADVDRTRIVFHGRSIGGGAVCALARRRKPRAIVLQSTFTSLPDVARRFLVPGFLLRDRFDNLSFLAEYDGPVLLGHGRRDALVPHVHAERLHRAAPRSRLLSDEGRHNDSPLDATAFFAEVRALLLEAGVLVDGAAP
jgi:fermentation-respiration switch protein FrsA (DUF1100 family)